MRVVVVEENGELVGLLTEPSQPTIRMRLGTLQPPALERTRLGT
jgi:hypothetical protein